MKKLLCLLVSGSFCVLALFLGCNFYTPPDAHDTSYSTDLDRKDVLALKHLQIPSVSEDILASYVMDFINIDAASEAGTGRSVQPVPAVVIAKTKEIIHTVQTGFAETTADKRSARSIIGPGQIPFYVFTLENQTTGTTGFALACGDNRIGNILAVAEEGSYDDDNPFLGVFYSQLEDYIENTIAIYNSITQADIANALKKNNESARATAPDLDVTDVGRLGGFITTYKKDDKPLPVTWAQRNGNNTMYNDVVMEVKKPPANYYYTAGCGPVAIAQIMAYYQVPKGYSKAPGYENIEYNWTAMIDKTRYNKAVGVLMYEIGLPENANSIYNLGLIAGETDYKKKGEGGALTNTFDSRVRIAFKNMGYKDPGNFITYDFSGVKSSIDNEEPVMVLGYAKEITTSYIFGIQAKTYDEGHFWVIDGCREMKTKVKDKATGEPMPDPYPLEYVHCNMGWGGSHNGWYISGVFDANYTDGYPNYPWADKDGSIEQAEDRSVGDDNFFRYGILMLTGIKPK